MQELFDHVFRIAPEPIQYLEDKDIHELLTDKPQDYIKFVFNELKKIAHGEVILELPSKQIFRDPTAESDFRVMPCVLRSAHLVRKTVKLVGTNTIQQRVPGKITVGKAFVVDPAENFISHEFDACLLSSARTGLCAALAVQLLADERKNIAIFGAGRVGYYTGFYLSALGQVESILFYDSDPGRAQKTASLLQQKCPGITIDNSKMKPKKDADVLIIATNSSEPVYHPDDFYAGTTISLGADTEWQHELDRDLANDSILFTDTLDSMNYGDLKAWQEAGLVSAADVTDLLKLVKDGWACTGKKRRVFISTGTALFDNLTIGYLLYRLDE